MDASVYNMEGKEAKRIEVPSVFTTVFREDLVRRALLSEQSRGFQPQGHSPLAGMQTTAAYIGRMNSYRTGRHMGIAMRPRQKLGGGAMGDVRRIPSSVKGRRAHPHTTKKILSEEMNVREYRLAIASAIGASASEIAKKQHAYEGQVPVVVDDSIEKMSKTKDIFGFLSKIGFSSDLELSHAPRLKKGHKRYSHARRYRKSLLIVVVDKSKVSRAARNIPGVDICNVSELSVSSLAPGSIPRLTVWSEGAVKGLERALEGIREIRSIK